MTEVPHLRPSFRSFGQSQAEEFATRAIGSLTLQLLEVGRGVCNGARREESIFEDLTNMKRAISFFFAPSLRSY